MLSVDERPSGVPISLGGAILTFASGVRGLVLQGTPRGGPESTEAAEMWALAKSDVLITTHGSSFASVARAHVARRGSERATFAVTREGSCLPWGNGGAPMSWGAKGYEEAACWSERAHRTPSWGTTPPPWERPPRGRVAGL